MGFLIGLWISFHYDEGKTELKEESSEKYDRFPQLPKTIKEK